MTITFLAPDGVPVTAQQERQARAVLYGGGSGRPLGARSGFRVGTLSTILTATSTTWTLQPCSVMIDPGAATHQGGYPWASDANITGAVTAADATYARKDIVYIQVNDSSSGDGSGATTAPVAYLAGTPSATPTAPALPARSFLVGTISVPVSGGGSPTVVLNPARFVAAGARLLVASQAERDALTPYLGLEILRTDLTQVSPFGIVERWNGGTWDHLGQSEWTFNQTNGSFTSGILFGSGALTNDAARTTDQAFVTTSAETLVVRDAGLYSVTLTGTWNKPSTARCFSQVAESSAGVTFRASGAVDENIVTVTASNFRCAAGAVLTPSTFIVFASGTTTWQGRIRVTRVG